MTRDEVIINCCVNGMTIMRDVNPHTPVTPAQIVRDVKAVRALGASIVHVHARGPDGTPTWDPAVYRDIIGGIRTETPDVIVCATTSGRLWSEPARRAAVLLLEAPWRPDMASLTLGSMNFIRQASVNPPDTIRYLLDAMNANGIRPEFEVFDFGMIDYLRHLADSGRARPPFYVNLLLGNRGTADATAANLALMADRLPQGSIWAAAGIGNTQFFVHGLAVAMGGHVRVGIEDNPYADWSTKKPASNRALIRRVLALARAVERKPMSVPATRRHLNLSRPSARGDA